MNYKISLSSVRVPEEAYPLMERALRAGKISGNSEYVEEFEESICKFTGSKYCVAIFNGTMADAVAVAVAREVYRVRRVIVPALTFIAQPNSVRYNNLDVVFADVLEDWTMDISQCETGSDTLLFFTDLMGRIANYGVSKSPVIEDACEAFGSVGPDGKRAGTYGEMGTFSFFPSHTISTGEGGAVVTDDMEMAELCRIFRSHGAASNDPERKFTFPYLGFNGRMTTMQAVLGIALMGHIHEYIEEKRNIFKLMQEKLGGFSERLGEMIMPHGYPVEFASEEDRNVGMKAILKAGIECRKFFSCIPMNEAPYLIPVFTFPVAEHISRTNLYLPCHQNMSPEDVTYIIEVLDGLRGLVRK